MGGEAPRAPAGADPAVPADPARASFPAAARDRCGGLDPCQSPPRGRPTYCIYRM
jgi:hypothetical protein